VVLDRYSESCFIVDSSVVGYDGSQTVGDEVRTVGRKKLIRKAEPPARHGIAWPRWTGFRGMTVRDWLQLLVVPLALVVIGFLFTAQQDQRQQNIEDQRAQQAQKIENQRAEAERELAVQSAQDEALQAYLDQMSSLILEKDLRESKKHSEVRTLARARTLTVLRRLDSSRKGQVLSFLAEANLVQGQGKNNDQRVIKLGQADLNDADLEAITLSGADLSGAHLSRADLTGAKLKGTKGITSEELHKQAETLEGATMPNGQKYEDWLKAREGHKETGENGGPS
jgi:uncharacterized protein YjbI with pentapeptide repeats